MKSFYLFFFFVVFCLSAPAFSQRPDLHFKHITTNEGLSHGHVKSIIKDHMGLMWFGSTFGLNKYNGQSIKVYLNKSKDNSSLDDNDINFLFEDSKKNLWIATRTGLNRYNRELDNFTRHSEFGSDIVSSVYEDKSKNLWAMAGNLLFQYDAEARKFKLFLNCETLILAVYEDTKGNFWVGAEKLYTLNRATKQLKPVKNLDVKNANGFLEDKDHMLWILSYGDGVYNYDLNTLLIRKYEQKTADPRSLHTNTVTCINQDKHGNIWLGSLHGGLMLFDKKKEVFYKYLSTPGDPESLGFNSLKCIYRDDDGHMWVGTYSSGVDFITERNFTHLYNDVLTKDGLNSNSIIALTEDKNGNICIGTDGGGLNIYNKETGGFSYYRHDPKNINSIGSNIVSAVLEDSRGNLWVGCWDGGISLIDRKTNKIKRFVHNPNDPDGSILNNSILYLYEGKDNKVWIGTLTGLNSLDPVTHEIERYDLEVRDLKNYINCMLEDEDGRFWVGTWGGLTLLDKRTKKYTRFLPNENDSTSISDDKIFTLYIDSKNRFWIGTAGGLNLYNRKSKVFSAYRVKDGLPSDAIYGILEDSKGYLWLSTANGISKFDPEKETFKNYFVDDGLQANQFKEHAAVRLKSGEMVFGGVNGINIFTPDKIQNNNSVPPVVLTDFKIFNTSVPVGTEHSPLKQNISITDQIILSYKQSVISFEFVSLNYLVPEKNQYAYMMEGFEQDWNYVKNQRNATYTNLDPGEYTFRVKGSNNDLIWNNEGASVRIIITPPFWKTWWFNTLIALSLVLIVVSIILYRDRNIKKQKTQLEMQVQERTAEILCKNEELETQADHLKSANHDIREKEQKLGVLYNEIRDNIRAAEVIQKYILPSQQYIKKYLPDSFIFYKPKDVVSGDFYWFDVLHEKKIIAVADCTGHGVSGAFMSINGHHLLNQAIYSNNFANASEILDRLNDGVIREFHKAYEETDFKDGMDISLCVLDEHNMKLNYSGANHPMYLLRNNEIIQIRGNKFSIGSLIKNQIVNFTNHTIDLQKGDVIYLFSDGYADQIGGAAGDEKFMYFRFRELLAEIGPLDMDEQLDVISSRFEMWKGNNYQLDDVLVMGFRV